MLLTYFAFSDQFHGVIEHRGLIIPLPYSFSCQGPSFDMIAINALVYLSKYVVGIFLSYTFEEGCRKTSFIKGPLQRSEST